MPLMAWPGRWPLASPRRSKIVLVDIALVEHQRRSEEYLILGHLDGVKPAEVPVAGDELLLVQALGDLDRQVAEVDGVPQDEPLDRAVLDVGSDGAGHT